MSDSADAQLLQQTSKYLSLLLRHSPDQIGLHLDAGGWAVVDELIAKAEVPLTRVLVQQVVENSDKQRFSLSPDGARIRANQGHSFPVDLDLSPVTPPGTLFHGTARGTLPLIMTDGLKPMKRQHVHLSADAETARKVGLRHGSPVVLTIQVTKMHGNGHTFFQSVNGVWLTEAVPVIYIDLPDKGADIRS